jgi:protease IV
VDQVDSIGQGRVWTGIMAKELGLVDELGGLEDAITAAAQMAKLEADDYRKVEYPEQKNFLEEIMRDLNDDAKSWVRSEVLGDDLELVKQFEAARRARASMGIQARMPFDVEVH